MIESGQRAGVGNLVDLASRGLAGAYCSNGKEIAGAGQMMVLPGERRSIAVPPYVPSMLVRKGFGDAGASAFTMTAAQALDEHLTTNNCAGCDDMRSSLRQLTFAFKAACLTDPSIMNQVSMNMSSALAMTAFGPGTFAALKLVLGASRTYDNGPCTDDNGICLSPSVQTPQIPNAVIALEQQLASRIKTAIQQVQFLPQADIVNALEQGFAALINQIGFELAKLPSAQPAVVLTPASPTSPSAPAQGASTGWTTTEKVIAGSLAGLALAGGIVLVYHAGKRS